MEPLFSRSFIEIITDIFDQTSDPIAGEILKIDDEYEQIHKEIANYESPVVIRIINDYINTIITDKFRAISIRIATEEDADPTFECSFLPKGREMVYSDNHNWSRVNRQTGKPTRILQQLIVKEFKQYDWEVFGNRLKARVTQIDEFKLVRGEDIRYWYNGNHYYRESGTLGNSCMRYESCGDYMDVYVDNAAMLITTRDDQLTGRAIVWELKNGITILDRIYTCFDFLTDRFLTYAKEHKWWIREDNCLLPSGDPQYFLTPDDNYKNPKCQQFIIHTEGKYENYPYIDSFRYVNEAGDLSTFPDNEFCDCADSTDGSISYNEDEAWMTCANCGREFGYDSRQDDIPDELAYCEDTDDYRCYRCRWQSDLTGQFYSNNTEPVSYYSRRGDALFADQEELEAALITTHDQYLTRCNYIVNIVDIDGDYYDVDNPDVYWDSTNNKFAIKDECVTT